MRIPGLDNNLLDACERLAAKIYAMYEEDYRSDHVYEALMMTQGITTDGALAIALDIDSMQELAETRLMILRAQCRLVKLSEESELAPLDE